LSASGVSPSLRDHQDHPDLDLGQE
jgi:hypothetical protein